MSWWLIQEVPCPHPETAGIVSSKNPCHPITGIKRSQTMDGQGSSLHHSWILDMSSYGTDGWIFCSCCFWKILLWTFALMLLKIIMCFLANIGQAFIFLYQRAKIPSLLLWDEYQFPQSSLWLENEYFTAVMVRSLYIPFWLPSSMFSTVTVVDLIIF